MSCILLSQGKDSHAKNRAMAVGSRGCLRHPFMARRPGGGLVRVYITSGGTSSHRTRHPRRIKDIPPPSFRAGGSALQGGEESAVALQGQQGYTRVSAFPAHGMAPARDSSTQPMSQAWADWQGEQRCSQRGTADALSGLLGSHTGCAAQSSTGPPCESDTVAWSTRRLERSPVCVLYACRESACLSPRSCKLTRERSAFSGSR